MSMRIAQKRSREEADAAAAAELATADTDDSDEEPIAPSVRQETPPDSKGVKAKSLSYVRCSHCMGLLSTGEEEASIQGC